MFKLSYVCLVILLISACKPTVENSQNQLPEELQCIDSQSECEVATKLANFSIKFSQNQLTSNIKAEEPFTIALTVLAPNQQHVHKDNITKITAHMEGRDMFMGKVPVFFQQNQNGHTFIAESLLASCSGNMVWRLWVTAETAEQQQQFFVDFTSEG
ncbi:hypothetical protein AADZ84_00495 [Colwelliaceae bacterium MEBiC 14330]